ncbi:hypothetical protein HZB69_03025 [Candidatus Amesbacteria bacterium]|nr:hypothetical protein [Candidatus Amesbacteria bacterium]
MHKLWWVGGFAIGAPLTLVATFLTLVLSAPAPTIPKADVAYTTQVLSPKDDSVPTWNLKFGSADGRVLLITNYLKKYKSPLLPHARELVEISDKYGLDWRLLAAIAQQESNLCKKIPVNSYNCWGYGIYGDLVTRFESFVDGMDTVARGLKKNYVDKGLDTPEKIMAKYTPPSQGSWAKGVNQFLSDIE